MKKRLLGLLLSLSLAAGMFTGCGSKAEEPAAPAESEPAAEDSAEPSETPEETQAEGKVYRIGVSTQAWKYEFIKNMVNALNALDDEMDNIELILVDSEDSVEKQLSDVDTMIAQKVDGILLNCLSLEGSSAAVEACKAAGIPLVEFISYTENEEIGRAHV